MTRLQTHDEIIVECRKDSAEYDACTLRWFMQQGFDWSEGLPLMSEESVAYFYTKHPESVGL